jgi:GNAT superfamily N-acetyltransferase
MVATEASKIGEIDRSEEISLGFFYRDGKLVSEKVDWQVPRWTADAEGDFNVDRRIEDLRVRLETGDIGLGAFDGERLAGYIVLHENLTAEMAQLAELFVSRTYRKQGIASQLTDRVVQLAKDGGARKLYVSAVPSGSAVRFYMSQGFRLAEKVHPDLYALEPEDIHLVKTL